jgi:hypothetical protein
MDSPCFLGKKKSPLHTNFQKDRQQRVKNRDGILLDQAEVKQNALHVLDGWESKNS